VGGLMSILATLALTLALAAESKADAAKNYTIDVSGTTTSVKSGESGRLILKIQPAKGYHVSPEAPLKITLSGDGVKLSKESLSRQDAADQKSEAPQFQVGFGTHDPGKKAIAADAMFFVCSDTLCERKTEKLTVQVDVKP